MLWVLDTGGATPMLNGRSLFERCETLLVGTWSVACKQTIRSIGGHMRSLTTLYFERKEVKFVSNKTAIYGQSDLLYVFSLSNSLFMASNAMSRIENQDGTCLVQILLSRTFLPWSFCTEKHKITLLAFCSQKQTECESHFKWFCTSLVKSLTLTLISPSSVLSSSPRGF